MHGGHHAGAGPDERPQGIELDLTLRGNRGEQHLGAGHAGHDLPRHDVGVVLHLGDHDLVALAQLARTPRPGHQVDGLGGVLGEHQRLARVVDEARSRCAPGLKAIGGLCRHLVHATVHVGVGLAVVRVHRVQHHLRLLRGGRRIEVVQRAAVGPRGDEHGELRADRAGVQRGAPRGRHQFGALAGSCEPNST